MNIRKLIATTGAIATATAVVVSAGTSAASAAPTDCAALHRASMRAAIQVDFLHVLDSAGWDRAYTNWLRIEAALEASNC